MNTYNRTSERPRDRDEDQISSELKDMVQRQLDEYEQVRWMGTPKPRYFTSVAKAQFIFAIPWTAFALFWMCGAAGFKFPDFSDGFSFFPLFGLPFVAIGIGMLMAPLREHKKDKGTVYVITDNRAIIIEGSKSTRIRSYPPERLQEIYREENKDGTGNVIFSSVAAEIKHRTQGVASRGFLRIQHPREAEKLLKELGGSGYGQ